MVRHIVLLDFKDDVSEGKRAEIMEAVGALKDSIPGIRSYSSGVNTSREGLSKGFTHGFVMELEDEAARDRYLVHPEHVKVAQEVVIPALKHGTDSIVVFDYEVRGSR